MKVKMYQVPVTEMYAVSTQVLTEATVNPVSGDVNIPGGGTAGPGDVWD